VSAPLLAAAREALADAYFRTGDYDRVAQILDEALRGARDRRTEAAVLAQQGMLLHFRAIELSTEERAALDPSPEQALFGRALAMRRDLGDGEEVVESLFQVGLVHQVLRRDGETAALYFRETLALVEASPDADALLRSDIHRHVGFDLLLREQRHPAALDHLRASLELRRDLEERGWTVGGLVALAMAERLAGLRDDAIAHAREGLELAHAEGLRERHGAAAANELAAAESLPAAG
jgi:tetratricopeptide (TPR) repeat protein